MQVSWTLSSCLLYLTLRDFNLQDGSQIPSILLLLELTICVNFTLLEVFPEMEYLSCS